MLKRKPSPTMAQKSSNSRDEAMNAAMSGAKKITDVSITKSKRGTNKMAPKKAPAKKMMNKTEKPAAKASGLTAGQKKLPAFIQKSILAKKTAKKK